MQASVWDPFGKVGGCAEAPAAQHVVVKHVVRSREAVRDTAEVRSMTVLHSGEGPGSTVLGSKRPGSEASGRGRCRGKY